MIYDIAQNALRLLPPELAHHATLRAIQIGLAPRALDSRKMEVELAGLILPNPIGLAAGFDKNAQVPDAMLKCGFGFVECGTVTPRPQLGNPKPRIFRLNQDEAIINALGFNNYGVENFARKLKSLANSPGIIGANLGANKDSTDKIADYVFGLHHVWEYSSYITINISSPNTKGLRDLQAAAALEELLGRINEERARLTNTHGEKPIFLKVAPDIIDAEVSDISQIALATKIDALIISNTTISRPPYLKSPHSKRQGGLSGKPLFELSTQKLRDFKSVLGDKMPLIGVGGISSGDDAIKKLEAGATAIQLYTGLVFHGMGLLREIRDAVAEYMHGK